MNNISIARIEKSISPKFLINGETGCWEWIGYIDRGGYARLNINYVSENAHRVLYTLIKGNIPSGLTIDHLCKIRHCINPEHLEPVTLRENIRRGTPHNRIKTYCVHGHKFTFKNTYTNKLTGKRTCRTCQREYQYEWQHGRRQHCAI